LVRAHQGAAELQCGDHGVPADGLRRHGARRTRELATDQAADRGLREGRKGVYRTENGVALIELRLSRIAQLFNSLDPSPFPEKDLDAEAEEYIFTSAREIGPYTPFRIVIHVPPSELPGAGPVKEAIHHYFAYRLDATRREIRYEMHLGRIGLAIGLAFLFGTVVAREFVQRLGPGSITDIVAEGLLISGWVAMWRPIQTFLYDWWPIRRTRAVLERLAESEVELRPEPAVHPPATPR
jgi:hypothetical protein